MAGPSILGTYTSNTAMDNTSANFKDLMTEAVSMKTQIVVGNLPTDTNEDHLRELFSKYGNLTDIYLDGESASIKMDSHSKASMAKSEFDGKDFRGRQIHMRITSSNRAAIRVDNLSPVISNELLAKSLSQFGPIESAVVVVDNEGRSTSWGIVQFNSEESAHRAIQKIQEGYFLMTSSPRVVSATIMEQSDSEVGLPDQKLIKSTEYYSERELNPRFADVGSFEEDCAKAWKTRLEMEREQKAKFDKSLKESRGIFESEMEICQLEHRTLMKKQDLLRRQEEQRKEADYLEASMFAMPSNKLVLDFSEEQLDSSQSSYTPQPTTEKNHQRHDMTSSRHDYVRQQRGFVGIRCKKVKRVPRVEPRLSVDSLPRVTSSPFDSLLLLSNNPLHDDVTSDDGIEQDAIGSSDNSPQITTTTTTTTPLHVAGAKPHKCPFCPKRYYQKGNMRRHMRIHSQATQHKCEVCHKLFATRWEKNRHVSKKCSQRSRGLMDAGESPQLAFVATGLVVRPPPSLVVRPPPPSSSSSAAAANHSNIILPY